MKKYLSILLIFCVLFSVCGCSTKDNDISISSVDEKSDNFYKGFDTTGFTQEQIDEIHDEDKKVEKVDGAVRYIGDYYEHEKFDDPVNVINNEMLTISISDLDIVYTDETKSKIDHIAFVWNLKNNMENDYVDASLCNASVGDYMIDFNYTANSIYGVMPGKTALEIWNCAYDTPMITMDEFEKLKGSMQISKSNNGSSYKILDNREKFELSIAGQ